MQKEVYRSLILKNKRIALSSIEELCSQGKIPKGLLALSYYTFGDHKRTFTFFQELEIADKETMYSMEVEMLLNDSSGRTDESERLALQIIEAFPEAAFAQYLLAYKAVKKRRPLEAIKHFETLLENYSEHPTLSLLLAENYIYAGNYRKAMNFIDMSSSSFEKTLYRLLAPLGLATYKLILLFFSLLLFTIGAGLKVSILMIVTVTVILLTGAFLSLRISRGTLIFSRLVYIEFIMIISWGIGAWIWLLT